MVLDTLIKPHVLGVDFDDVKKDLPGYKSLHSIHGIKTEWLNDAPSFESVRDHIMEICGCKKIDADPVEAKPQDENEPPNKENSASKSEAEIDQKYVFVCP